MVPLSSKQITFDLVANCSFHAYMFDLCMQIHLFGLDLLDERHVVVLFQI